MSENNNTIRVLKVEPGKEPYVKDIPNEYVASQEEVEGDIDCLDLGDGCVIVNNALGKMDGMTPNRRYGNDIICGSFFICGGGVEGDFISLTNEQIKQYSEQFSKIEQFQGNESELEPRIDVMTWG